jgi:hypothetical protein
MKTYAYYAVFLLFPSLISGLLELALDEFGVEANVPTGLDGGSSRAADRELMTSSKDAVRLSSIGSGEGGCQLFRVYYKKANYDQTLHDIASKGKGGNATTNTFIGYTVDHLPIYDARSEKEVGYVTETNLYTGKEDCVAKGAFNFGKSKNVTKHQIFYQGTCLTKDSNAVTGGTGYFTCSDGLVKVFRKTSNRIIFDLQVCGNC